MHTFRLLPAFLVLLAALVAPPGAFAGDYSVRLTTTSGSFWSTHGRGPFIATAQRVYSGIGIFQTGDYKAWRAVVPGEGARIVGGRIVVSMSTPHVNMRGRILVGTGNTPVVLYDGGATGAVERSVTSGAHDWLQFDLRSAGAATTSRVAENYVNFASADMVLRDTVPPVISPISLPAAGTWHAASTCIPFSIRMTDQGGGLLRGQVRRAGDGVVITEVVSPQSASLKPGPNEQHLVDCVQPHERVHGDTTFVATAWDVSGVARELAFTVRADQTPPSIAGGPAEGTRYTHAQPELAFQVGDHGAGLAAVHASLDGHAVPVSVVGATARIGVGPIAIGSHVLAIAATDGAGNTTRVERRFSIADVAAPTLTLESPAATGFENAQLLVRATDDMSGVDPARWTLTVDGRAIDASTSATQLSAKLGPLATGAHVIVVRAADRVGNVATLTHRYEVLADVAAPTLVLESPGARGEATAFLSVRANDDRSGVDPARWLALVNGEQVPVQGDAAKLIATIGPLAPGVQHLEVRAADRAGNVVRLRHDYEVVGAAVPSMPNVGPRTGLFVVKQPVRPVAFGTRAAVSVFVSRNGRPMSGQLLVLRRGRAIVARAESDARGVARIVFRVAAPGRWQVEAEGLSMEPVRVPLRIAPRISIRTSTQRPVAGQRVLVTGRIAPGIRGRRIAVEARIGGVWYPIRRSASTSATGAFRTSVVASTRGTVWVRVRMLAVGAWAPARSNQVRLAVRGVPRSGR